MDGESEIACAIRGWINDERMMKIGGERIVSE